jgi:hypothetical protein
MGKTWFLSLSFVLIGFVFSISALASGIECSTSNAQYHFKQFQSDGGVPPTQEMIRPHWFVNENEDLTVTATVNESSRVIVAQVICPSWPHPPTEPACWYNEIDSTVQMRLYGQNGNALWAADVLMLCHQTKYVGPPIP